MHYISLFLLIYMFDFICANFETSFIVNNAPALVIFMYKFIVGSSYSSLLNKHEMTKT